MKDNINNARRQADEKNIQSYSRPNITQHALQYAVNYQLPSLKITCQPGVKDQIEGKNIMKALFIHIHDDFCKLNNQYNRPIGFDTWYVDKQGDLICFTSQIELFVYLWDVDHYPPKLLNTLITPVPPTHLPPQHSIIFKYVPRTISFDELLEAVSDVCQSKLLLEEMKGSMTNKSRHIRLDLTSKEETKKILNSGVFPLNGYLIEVTEFLAPPKLLICSRCNRPGHIRKECNGPFDRCKRCGMNKAQGDHIQCLIKCHHCEGEHIATDYRCPVIVKFRGELIDELKRRPELLPQNIQLFIPVEFRNGGKNFIGCQQKEHIPSPSYLHSSHTNVWPSLNQPVTQNYDDRFKQDFYDDMKKEIKLLRNDYEKLKLVFDQREKELMIKYENNKNDCISKVYTVVNEVVPIITSSLKSLHIFIEKIVKNNEDINLKNEYNILQFTIEQNLVMLNDRNDLVIEHQRATAMLNEKTNDIFRHGLELMSSNEQ
ncbi:unnamed protein product [Rotaria sp. Silwood2]|nr:unnamed protein product [Rotaria sp. Silwood2]CAF3134873.1 unnamed protein product [Rotaria sp. Silwood2]CAF3350526.1 unnamed protein product [Rotaria sp. Silwood2]CAF4242544.1 unnamed protein product [Rotaria sp. Silwood2]CAF4464950.1 unnamed protein product [Rotaria sp. Silwood2]